MKKKRILIIACEAWREDTNAGNVLVNLFGGMLDDFEFAEIYVASQLPKNNICTKYYQLSENEMIHSFLHFKSFGKKLPYPIEGNDDVQDFTNSGKFYSFRQNFPGFIYPIRNLLWLFTKWKTDKLRDFVLDFNPDIIFAPIYFDPFMARLAKYVQNICGKKMVTYTGDDHITLKQFSLSPLYWINRIITRRTLINLSKRYSKLYTMTDEQKDELENILHIPVTVFKKGGDFSVKPERKTIQRPIKIIYGGGLIFGRYTTLAKVRQAVANINKKYGHTFEFYIYTQTAITEKYKRLLHDGENSFLMGKVGQEKLNKAYSEAGIALHVESFELKQRLSTKVSFSTKIIDLLKSNCCIIAICWEKSSPYIYLNKQDAAICVGNPENLEAVFKEIMEHPEIIQEYAEKAWNCGCKNHKIEVLQKEFRHSFFELLNNH